MKCFDKDIKEFLPLYLEQALEQPEREKVGKHLESCADCRTELTLLRAMAEELVPDPGEAFWAQMPSRIYGEIKEQQTKRSPGFSTPWRDLFMPRWAWAAAAVTVVAVLSWILVRPVPKDTAVAVLPADEFSYENIYADMDVAALQSDEFERVGVWADGQVASLSAEAADVLTNSADLNIDEELADMDVKALERFSSMLDRMKREG